VADDEPAILVFHTSTSPVTHSMTVSLSASISQGPAWNRLVIYSRFGMEAKLAEASDGRLVRLPLSEGAPTASFSPSLYLYSYLSLTHTHARTHAWPPPSQPGFCAVWSRRFAE
jgi:hypothetical protein